MSLHDTLEVSGEEYSEKSYTRDRFGKKHSVTTGDEKQET